MKNPRQISPRRGKTPIWQGIADTLRGDISEGRYTIGDKLPTEAALAERFGVNRHTVRHAVSKLVAESLLRTRRGSGVFVAATPTDYPIGRRVRFNENLLAAGHRPEKRALHIARRAATKGEATALNISNGADICAYHGLSLSDGHPMAIFESLFPLDRLPGIASAFETTTSVTEALRQVGVPDYARATTRLTATAATATQALHLQVAEGDPLLKSTSVNVAEGVGPVEYGRTFFAGDRVTLTLET